MTQPETERTALERLAADVPTVGTAFKALRASIAGAGDLPPLLHEVVLVATLAVAGERDAFMLHVQRARGLGMTEADLRQVVLLTLGSTLGLPEVVRALSWIDESRQD